MSNSLDCCNTCATVQPTQVPGLEGAPGLDGVDGVNAYTHTTADFVVPNIGDTVLAALESSVWLVIGQVLIFGVGVDGAGNGPAHFTVTALPDSTSATIQFLGLAGDLLPGDTVTSGATVSPSAA